MTERKKETYAEIGRRSYIKGLTTRGTIIGTNDVSLWRIAQRRSAFEGHPVSIKLANDQIDTSGKLLDPNHYSLYSRHSAF